MKLWRNLLVFHTKFENLSHQNFYCKINGEYSNFASFVWISKSFSQTFLNISLSEKYQKIGQNLRKMSFCTFSSFQSKPASALFSFWISFVGNTKTHLKCYRLSWSGPCKSFADGSKSNFFKNRSILEIFNAVTNRPYIRRLRS